MEKYLNNLNSEQLEAVINNEIPLLVLAGAGSGKTTLLTVKFAYLVNKLSINPYKILAVTFTNKAANEMKERILKIIGNSYNFPWICTFHSFGVKVLRRFIEHLGYKNNFNIYDDGEQKSFIKKLLKDELKLDDKIYNPKKVASFINSCKNKGLSPDDLEFENDFFNANLKNIYLHYQNRMKENNSVDFGDLLFLTYNLLSTNKDVLNYYKHLFEYILVDEYQDTNHIQYKLIKLIGKDKKGICVVGDDDQSIYGWRGATVENILKFEKDFPGAKIIKLEQNYRSTGNILNAANRLISKNRFRKGKNLWTSKGDGEKIEFFNAYDEYAEAKFVVRKIKEIGDYSSCAILYRTNSQSRVFEDELVKNNIPYIVIGGLKFFDRKEIKDIIAYLKIIDGSEDLLLYERVINVPARGVGNKTFFKIIEISNEKNISIFRALEEIVNKKINFPARATKGIKNFYDIIKRFRELKGKIELADMVSMLIEDSNYLSIFENLDSIERENRIGNLEELISSVKNFEKNNDNGTLTDYLDNISLTSSVDVEIEGKFVSLITIHGAKGLEFDNVFLVGFEDNLLPHINSKNNEMEIEEERRLCYVAFTRARKKLFLSYCQNRSRGKFSQQSKVSPFLKDIPKELLNMQKHRKSIAPKDKADKFELTAKTGSIVNHNRFGIGKIISIIGKGEDQKIVVFFKNYGKKTLLLKKAPIQFL